MIHPAAIAMYLLDTVSQAPVVVQIPPQTPDPSWKWVVQSVVPIIGGTVIAVWSFIQNRESEQKQWQRNQAAAHDQWVLDQKKIEWREILKATSSIERTIPAVSKLQDRYDSVSKYVPEMISELLAARGSCVFIADDLVSRL
ncbi:hypothetical protein [Terracidiphilus sp.]|jgi:hypothetical protein|uniref:hypothetical protein n=1 Tax=Terracidiphilus sp. TaxID=1964191 RepID=UPI003C147168